MPLAAAARKSMISIAAGESANSASARFDILAHRPGAVEDRPVGLAQRVDLGARHAGTLHADDVEPAQELARFPTHGVGNDVADDRRAPPRKAWWPMRHELVHGAEAADDDEIADLDMAAQRRHVGEGDIVADDAVMGDMRIGEEIAIVADRRLAAAGVGAGMHGDAFADRAVVADHQRRAAALVPGVLRRAAEHRHRIDLAVARRCRRADDRRHG